jgi:hypothetical protein
MGSGVHSATFSSGNSLPNTAQRGAGIVLCVLCLFAVKESVSIRVHSWLNPQFRDRSSELEAGSKQIEPGRSDFDSASGHLDTVSSKMGTMSEKKLEDSGWKRAVSSKTETRRWQKLEVRRWELGVTVEMGTASGRKLAARVSFGTASGKFSAISRQRSAVSPQGSVAGGFVQFQAHDIIHHALRPGVGVGLEFDGVDATAKL